MLRLALILGLLSAVGPFAIDMYLPALPAIAADFGVTEAAVQTTLTAYFLAFGVAQLFYGPMADAMGRRPPLFLGLAIFAVGSLGAAFAGTIGSLASLDFLGYGLPSSAPSLGEMTLQAKQNLQAPWLGFTAFFVFAIMLSLLVFIFEGVRDAFDPRKTFQ